LTGLLSSHSTHRLPEADIGLTLNMANIPTVFVALTVVRHAGRYLLVEEHTGLWSIPGGRADAGELLAEAAKRECLEESGVAIELEALIRIEQTPLTEGARVRAFYLARPIDAITPKSIADEHTLRAAWFTPAELAQLSIRYRGYARAIAHVEAGARLLPLDALVTEHAPW
jgi:ADP-ribose pyrophosphatase YjhB (NUDIX family)